MNFIYIKVYEVHIFEVYVVESVYFLLINLIYLI